MAEGLQVLCGVGSTLREWQNVIDIGGGDGEVAAGAVYAEGMGAQVHQADLAPACIVAALGWGAALGVDLLVALLVGLSLVIGTA